MKTRAVWIAVFAFAVALFLEAGAEAQQLPKSGKYTGKYLNSATVYKLIELEKDHSFVQELVEGVFLNDLGEGFLHGAGTTCPVIGEVTKAGFTGNGWCVMTDQSGDKAFLVWKCGPLDGGGCEGDFQWTGGTGKFVGLKGNNWFAAHPIANTNQEIVQWKGEWQLP